MTLERFPPRRVSEYVGQPGHEVGQQLLSPAAYQAIADAKSSGRPCELVVTGMFTYPDGRRYLDLGVDRAYIEATTNHRHSEGRLRYLCPYCDRWDDKHTKSCEAPR